MLTVLPEFFIRRSRFTVTPVLAWWRQPGPVSPGDLVEVIEARRIPVAELADPANRLAVRPPARLVPAGMTVTTPAFRAGGMLIWGFTAMVVDRLLALGGWERPWDASHPEELPPDALAAPGARATAGSPRARVRAPERRGSPPAGRYGGQVTGDFLDLILVVLVVAFAVAGYRQGFIIGVLSFAGFIGGGAIGALIGPRIARALVDGLAQQALVAIIVVFVVAMIGQLLASGLGVAMRSRLTWRPATVVDSIGGAAVSVISVLLIAWLIASAVAYAPFPLISRQVNNSAVLRGVDRMMPPSVSLMFSDFRSLLARGPYTQVFGALGAEGALRVRRAGPGGPVSPRPDLGPAQHRQDRGHRAELRPPDRGLRASCSPATGSSPTRTWSPGSRRPPR